MFQMKAEHVLAKLVDQHFRSEKRPQLKDRYVEDALYIRLDCRLQKWDGDPEGDGDIVGPTVHIHYLISRPFGPGGTTRVFCCVGAYRETDPTRYQLRSSHDSCWRSDGFRDLNTVYFDMRDRLELAPGQEIHEWTWIDSIERRVIFIEPGSEPFGPNRYNLIAIERPDPT